MVSTERLSCRWAIAGPAGTPFADRFLVILPHGQFGVTVHPSAALRLSTAALAEQLIARFLQLGWRAVDLSGEGS